MRKLTFDGMVTKSVTLELDQQLRTGRILKIHQPTETELIFTVRANGKNHSLLLSIHPVYGRIHLTNDKYKNPSEPPMFCMLLRKHMEASFIESIEQFQNERIIKMNLKAKNEIGDETRKQLIIEIMGKHSNLLLIDQEKGHILDAMKHVSAFQNRHRTLLPGHPYVHPPTQDKQDPFELSFEEIKAGLTLPLEEKALISQFMGVSPILEKEILSHTDNDENNLKYFYHLIDKIKHQDINPVINRGPKESFYLFTLKTFEDVAQSYQTINQCLDAFYSDKADRDLVKQRASDLSKILKTSYDKNKRKIKKQKQDLDKARKADRYQKQGELLTAHLHLVKPNQSEITVTDYYDENQSEITIPLNPNKSPSENAQSFFKTYQKLKTSKVMLEKEIKKAETENLYLDTLIEQIHSARVADLDDIREELEEEGYLKKKKQKKKQKKKTQQPSPEVYQSSDGTQILVGKNNKQNDYLTMKLADKRNIWLHTKDIPGSHVVIRHIDPSEKTIEEAALLAAYFSKAKQSSSVPVDFTEVKHVRKPNGAKPGFVIYDHHQTAVVTPSKKIVDQLRKE